jgi:hypothetical protein
MRRFDWLVTVNNCIDRSTTDSDAASLMRAKSTRRRLKVGNLKSIARSCFVASVCGVLLLLLLLLLPAPGSSVAAQGNPAFCEPQEMPAFRFGFQTLSSLLGDYMGTPIECEHSDIASGDTLQTTSTGLAFYRKSTNTPTFTDGTTHWALTDDGLVTWTGPSVDPPNAVVPEPPQAAPPATAPVAASPNSISPPPEPSVVGSWTYASVEPNGGVLVPAPRFPSDNRLFRVVGNNPIQVSTTQGRTWDQVSERMCGITQVSLVLSPTFDVDGTMIASRATPCALSRDAGRTWTKFPMRIMSSYSQASVAFSPTFGQDHRLWLSGIVGGHPSLELSEDMGATWRALSFPFGPVTVQGMAATGSASGHTVVLLAVTDSKREPSGRYFRSVDLGVTWQEITESFRDPKTLDVPSLSFRAGVDPDQVYAADSPSTWYSADGGVNWRSISERSVAAVTYDGCGVLSSRTDIELSCGGSLRAVVPAPPDTNPRVVSVASFADHGTVLLSAQHGLWTFQLRP